MYDTLTREQSSQTPNKQDMDTADADAASPLLYESLGGARSPPVASGSKRFGRLPSQLSSDGLAAYTELHAALGASQQQPQQQRNELGTINVCYLFPYHAGSNVVT